MAKNRVSEYLKNVGKSVVFSAVDTIPKNMESSSDFISTNASLFKDIFVATKDYKKTFERTSKMVLDSKIYKAADVAWKSTKESILTGSFYSKEREDKYSLEAMGELGDFSDMDVNFNNLDSSISESRKSESDILGSKIEKSNYNATEATCNMIANTADYIVSNGRANTRILATQNANMIGMLSKGFNATNQSIAKIEAVMTGPMMNHLDNSKKAYEKLTSGVDAIASILSEMNERQKAAYGSQNNTSKDKINIEDIMSSSGAPDLKAYMKLVGKNFKKAIPMGDMLFGNGMGEGSNLLLTFAANPLSFIPSMFMKSIIPKSLERSMKNFDSTLSGFFSTFVSQMNKLTKDNDSGILNMIGKIFGIEDRFKTSLDTSLYKKGAIPFDGETKKAITEVIPTYLRKIEKGINNGNSEKIFDYKSGKWITDDQIYNSGKSIKSDAVNNAFSEIIPEIKKYLDKHSSDDKYDYDKMQQSMMNMLEKIFDDGGYINFNNSKLKSKYSDYGVASEEYFKILLGALQTMPRQLATSMARNVMSSRSETTRRMKNLEVSGNDILNMYFNGSIDKELLGKTGADKFKPNNIISNSFDEKGNNIFYYLRVISGELHELRINGGSVSGTSVITGKPISKEINTKWIDTVPDNNKNLKEYRKTKDNEDAKYTKHIAALKAAKGDKKLLIQYSTYMDMNTANKIVQQMSNDEYDRYLKQAKEDYRADSKFQQYLTEQDTENQLNEGNGLIDRLISARGLKEKLDVVKQKSASIARIPSKSIEKILNVADEKLYQLMFGYKDDHLLDANGKPIQGFIGHMLYELQQSFVKFNDFIDEKILNPIKEKLGIENFGQLFDKIATKFGFNKDRREAIRNKISSKLDPYKTAIKRSFGDIFQDTKSAVLDTADNIMAMGKDTPKEKVDDSKLNKNIVVPKESTVLQNIIRSTGLDREEKNRQYYKYANPNATNAQLDKIYRENTRAEHDRKQQELNEVFGSNARGSKYVEKSGITAISKGELIIPSELNPFNKDAGKVSKRTELRNEKNIKNNFIKSILDKAIGTRAEGTGSLSDKIPPEYRAKLQNAKEKVDTFGPNAVGKGAVGAVGALLAGVNPLLGLALGGFVGVAQKSAKIQDWLFGIKNNETGERADTGIISKSLQDKFNKATRDDMKRLGLTGMALSLITPLGPIGGLMTGAALGFAKNNKTITDFLFGELNEKTGERINDGIIPPNVVEFIKKAAPNVAIGSIAAIIGGPFGFLGNILLGSGLGMVSATDKFQTWLFGDKDDDGKRHGGALDKLKDGVTDFIKNKIFNPLARFIKPVGQMIKNGIMNIANGIKDTTTSIIEHTIGTPLGQWFKEKVLDPGGKFFGTVFKLSAAIGKTAITLPFAGLGAIGDHIRRKQINKGTAFDMSASERLSFMKTRGGWFNPEGEYNLKGFDELMSGMSNEKIHSIRQVLGQNVNSKKEFSREIIQRKSQAFKDVDSYLKDNNIKLSHKKRDQLLKMAESGNVNRMADVARILGRNDNLTPEHRKNLYQMLRTSSNDMNELYENRKTSKLTTKEAMKQLRKLGVEGIDPKNMRKYYQLFKSEDKFRSLDKSLEKSPVENISEKTDKIYKVLSDLLEVNKALITNDKSGLFKRGILHSKAREKTEKDNQKRNNANIYADSTFNKIARKLGLKRGDSEGEIEKSQADTSHHMTRKEHLMSVVERKAARKEKIGAFIESGKEKIGSLFGKRPKVNGVEIDNDQQKTKVVQYNPIDNKFHTFIRDSKSGRMVPDNKGASEATNNGIFGKANNLLESFHNFGKNVKGLFVRDEKEKKTKEELENEEYNNPVSRLLTKLLGGSKNIAKMAGVGFLAWNAAALAGHGLEAFEDKVWPRIKTGFGKFTNFLNDKFSGLGSKIENIADFVTGGAITGANKGPGKGLPNLIIDSGKITLDWLTGGLITGENAKAGLPRLIKEEYFPWLLDGTGKLLERTVSASVLVFGKALPYILRGITAAIKTVFSTDFWRNVRNGLTDNYDKNKSFNDNDQDVNLKLPDTFSKEFISSYYAGSSATGPISNSNDYKSMGKSFDTSPYFKNKFNSQLFNINNNSSNTQNKKRESNSNNYNNGYSNAYDHNNGYSNAYDHNNGYSNAYDYNNEMLADYYNNGYSNAYDYNNENFYNDGVKTYDPITNTYIYNDNISTIKNNKSNRTIKDVYAAGNISESDIKLYNLRKDKNDLGEDVLRDEYGKIVAVKNSKGNYITQEQMNINTKVPWYQSSATTLIKGGILAKIRPNALGARLFNGKIATKGPFKIGRNIIKGTAWVADTPTRMITSSNFAKTFDKNMTKRFIKATGIQTAEEVAEETAKNTAKKMAKEGIEKVTKETVKTAAEKTAKTTIENMAKNTAKNSVEELAEAAVKGTAKNAANTSLIKKFLNFIPIALNKLFENKTIKQKFIKGIINSKGVKEQAAETMLKKSVKNFGAKLVKEAAEKASKSISSIILKIGGGSATAGILNVAFAAADFISGWNNCHNILGISKDEDVSWGTRLLTGSVKAINGFVTLGIVPEDILVSLFIDYLAPILKIDMSALQKQRQKAFDAVNDWNLNNPDDAVSSIQDLNNKSSLWNKIKNAFSISGTKEYSTSKSSYTNNKSAKTSYTSRNTLLSNNRSTKTTKSYTNRNRLTASGRDRINHMYGGYTSGLDQITRMNTSIPNIVNQYGLNDNTNVWSYSLYNEYSNNLEDNSKYLDSLARESERDIKSKNTLSNFKSKFTTPTNIINNSSKSMIYWTNRVLSFPLYMAKYMNDKLAGIAKNNNVTGVFRNFDSLINYLEKNPTASSTSTPSQSGANISGTNSPNKIIYASSGKGRNDYIEEYTQSNNPYSNMRYGNSTIAEEGCGPVAAANLLGKDIYQTADYAQRNGFVGPNGGTDINYFNSILSSQGIPNSQTSSSSDVKETLRNGGQAVLLGKDSSGGIDKAYSNRMHYITAKGIDNRGNVIIQDPDLGTRTMPQNKVFSGMKASVLVGNGRSKKYGYGTISFVKPLEYFKNPDPTYTAKQEITKAIENNNNKKAKESSSNTTMIEYLDGSNMKIISLEKYIEESKKIENILHQDLGSWSDISVSEMNEWIRSKAPAGSPFIGRGQVFIDAAKQSHLDPRYLLAHAAVESGWGTSGIAKTKHNYFGIGAFDANPSKYAYTMGDGLETGIIEGAKWIYANYYNSKYKQITIYKMIYNNGVHEYCSRKTSKTWANTIAQIMSKAPGYNSKIAYQRADSKVAGLASGDSSVSTTDTNNIMETISEAVKKQKPTLFEAIGNLGRSVLNVVWGKEKVDILFGSADSDTSNSNNSDTSNSNNSDTSNSNDFDTSNSKYQSGNGEQSPVDYMRSKLGKLKYSTEYNQQNPDKGWGSCASTVGWAYKKSYPNTFSSKPMSYRACDQSTDSRFRDVFVSKNFNNTSSLYANNPSDVDTNILLPGDLLYYRTNGGLKKKSVGGIGHVDMYAGNGTYLNHGGPNYGDIGTTEKKLSDYKLKTLVKVRRFNHDIYGSGRGEHSNNNTINYGKEGYFNNNTINYGKGGYSNKAANHIGTNNLINNINTPKVSTTEYSSTTKSVISNANTTIMSSSTYIRMMSAIVEILCRIADNTDKLSEISKVLSDKLNINISPETLAEVGKGRSKGKSNSAATATMNKSIKRVMQNSIPINNNIGEFNDKDTEYIVRAMKAIVTQ